MKKEKEEYKRDYSVPKKLENDKFDSKQELKKLSLKRLFFLQKMELDNLSHQVINNMIYDKNDNFKKIQEIIVINLIISKKLNEEKY